jgi:hypothetical protein
MNIFECERTSTAEVVMYVCIILVLSELKFQNTSKAIHPAVWRRRKDPCCHMEMGSEVQSINPTRIYCCKINLLVYRGEKTN